MDDIRNFPQLSLLASQGYNFDRTWVLALIAAVLLPPVLARFHQNNWRLSILQASIAIAVVSIALAFVFPDLRLLPWWLGNIQGFVTGREKWKAIPIALMFSTFITLGLAARANDQNKNDDTE